MIFSRFRKKKKSNFEQDIIEREKRYEKLVQPVESKHQVVDMCEQMIDAAREFEDAKNEYDVVTAYLNDIQTMENFEEKDKNALYEIAANVSKLNKTRKDFLKTESKISDSQYAQMQELEDEMPKAIRRFSDNEKFLATISKDLKLLEGEKTEISIVKEEAYSRLKQLRILSFVTAGVFLLAVVFCVLLRIMIDMQTSLILLIAAFFSVAAGSYIFLKYQSCLAEIHKCDINMNHVVALENRVKIKYVNMKNTVDYTSEKYHVKNSYELTYVYEKYQEAVREKERFKKTNDELEYYNKMLVSFLEKKKFYDARIWLNYANAIVDKKEMVELKHELLIRRQRLRGRMEYNVNVISELKASIMLHRSELGDRVSDVNKILNRIAEFNMLIQDED